MTRLGSLIKIWRATQGVNIRSLAVEIGLSAATLSRIERGHEMDARSFVKIMQWLTVVKVAE